MRPRRPATTADGAARITMVGSDPARDDESDTDSDSESADAVTTAGSQQRAARKQQPADSSRKPAACRKQEP